jgi:hypothetical protein
MERKTATEKRGRWECGFVMGKGQANVMFNGAAYAYYGVKAS